MSIKEDEHVRLVGIHTNVGISSTNIILTYIYMQMHHIIASKAQSRNDRLLRVVSTSHFKYTPTIWREGRDLRVIYLNNPLT